MFSSLARSLTPRTPRTPALLTPTSCHRSIASTSSAFATTSTLQPEKTPPLAPRGKYTLINGLVLKGIVTSTGKMAKTTTVTVERRTVDDKTLKEFKKNTKYIIHDPKETCVVGDQVTIRNCLPVSKRKRFELVRVDKGARERVEVMEEVAQAKVEKDEV